MSASDVIRQLEATGPSRELPGRAFLRVANHPLGAPILGAMGCYRPGIGTIALPNTGRLGRHIRQLGVIQPNDVKPTYRD